MARLPHLFACIFATLLITSTTSGQSKQSPFAGQWVGVPEFSGGKVFVQALCIETADGPKVTVWIPSMGVFSTAAEDITTTPESMSFNVPMRGGVSVIRIEWTVIPDVRNELRGTFSFVKGPEGTVNQPPSEFTIRSHPILPQLKDVAKYKGILQTPDGGSLTFLIALGDVDDELVGTIDIPEQGIQGLILYCARSLEDPNRIRLVIPVAGDATMDLEVEGDMLKGEFTQGQFVIPLTLQKGEIDFVVAGTRRPQEPSPPYSYDRSAFVVPTKAGHTLSGTLVVPRLRPPEGVPAVVFISGSGPQNRDGEVMNHRPFKVLADRLARKGIASFRYDDRGFGESTGDFNSATSLDFADDAVIFAETLEGLVLFLEALSKESEHLGLQVSWIKTKIQCFIQTVDQACEKVMCSGNLVDVVEVFPYLGSRITSDGSSLKEIDRRLGVAWGVVGSLK